MGDIFRQVSSLCECEHYVDNFTQKSNKSSTYDSRIILGSATACAIAAALIMVGEIASAKIRGRMTSMMQLFTLLGNATPAVIMAFCPSSKLLAYAIAAISVLCLVTNQLLMESPYYLISISRTDLARKNLQYLRSGCTKEAVDNELDIIETYIRNEQKQIKTTNFIGHLRLPFIRKPLLTMFLLNFFNNSSGIPMLLSVITIVLGENTLIAKKCYFIVTIIVALIFGGAVITLVDTFSRKYFYIFGAVCTGVLQTFNGFSWYFYNNDKIEYWYWLFFVGNLALGIFWNGILSPLKGTVRSEILPQTAKSTENVLSLVAQGLALISSFLIYNNTSLNVAYWIYAIFCEILAIVIYYQVPDGRGKTLARIQMELNDELT